MFLYHLLAGVIKVLYAVMLEIVVGRKIYTIFESKGAKLLKKYAAFM